MPCSTSASRYDFWISSSTASSRTADGPRTRSSMTRGALPGRKPATLVRRARRRVASSIDRSRFSGGTSISSRIVELGEGVAVTFIVGEYRRRFRGPPGRGVAASVGPSGSWPAAWPAGPRVPDPAGRGVARRSLARRSLEREPCPGVGGRAETRTLTPLTRHRLLRPARLPFRHSPLVESSGRGLTVAMVGARPRGVDARPHRVGARPHRVGAGQL